MAEADLRLVASRDRLDVHEELRQVYGAGATIILDRRREARRRAVHAMTQDRRRDERRRQLSPLQQDMWQRFGYIVVEP
jgi:hypothetical protein